MMIAVIRAEPSRVANKIWSADTFKRVEPSFNLNELKSLIQQYNSTR